ncbi:PE family protein [Mycobacterium sp. Marseille-P9652]|uniref:PE family protein n=1 Tax=Mycobacterium sp. Marseille-P9652 TaxID=2654950 RepID=UPI0012E932A6|nr:PE family protein [Mycobacterium sp. Marseille-P9652]
MSALIAIPELMAQASTDFASIGSAIDAAHMLAATPTLSVLPSAADEVSVGIAHLFSGYAHDYQMLAGKAAAFQEQFVQHLTASAASYASAEAANVASLLKPLAAISTTPVAAATAAESTLSDLITNLVTNTGLLLGGAAVAGIFVVAVSGFLSWLVADLVILSIALNVMGFIESVPLFNLALHVVIDVTNTLLTAFPALQQLVSAVTPLVQSLNTAIFLPAIVFARYFQALLVLSNPYGMPPAMAGLLPN